MGVARPVHPVPEVAGGARAAGAPVLVLGTGLRAGPWAVRSVRRAGFAVIGAHTEGRLAGGRSPACPRPLRHPHPVREPDALRAWVRDTVARTGAVAVLATTEDLVRVIADPRADLAGARFVGPTPAQYAALCDKGTLGDTAARAGVDHPATVCPRSASEAGEVPLPAIVKTRDSGEVADEVARSVICRTRAEVDAVVRRILAAGARPVVQEMLGGPRSNFHGLAHAGGLAGFATDVVREYPRGRGITSLARSIRPPDDFTALVERLLGAVGYRGPFSVQVIRRPSGSLAVHDVNLRLPATIGITITAGLDIPGLAVIDALGAPVGPLPATPRPTGYLGIDGEARALRDAVLGRGESPRDVLAGVWTTLRAGRPVIDPAPWDPFWWAQAAAGGAWSRAARLRRRSSPG